MVKLSNYQMLFFVFFILAGSGYAKPTATIDSLSGSAEIRRAGTSDWLPATIDAKLYNNDVIRVNKTGIARLKWLDGSSAYIHKNSQILITMIEDSDGGSFLNHATLFFGAAFFVLEKSLPRQLLKGETKIYTPTAVLSIRGTSFLVNVNKESGSTDVAVLNGSVYVGNIPQKVYAYVNASYKATLKKDSETITTNVVIQDNIDSMKTWVPEPVVDYEMAKQISNVTLERHLMTGNFDDKIIVFPFVDSSDQSSKWKISSTLATNFAERIAGTNKHSSVIVYDSIVQLPNSIAQKNRARFWISGTIKKFEVKPHAKIATTADNYSESIIAKVVLNLQLVSTDEMIIVVHGTLIGEAHGENIPKNSWKEIQKLTFDMSDKNFSESLLGKAIYQVIEQAEEMVIPKLQ